jgi:hypothetical protein
MQPSVLNNVNMCGIISEISMSMKKLNHFKTSVMKQILSIIAVAAVVTVGVVVFTNKSKTEKIDATELAQFKAWQDANEKAALAEINKPVIAAAPVAKKRAVNYTSPKAVSTSQNAAKTTSTTTQKKGISKAAKGAIIGGVGGAVIGGVVNKKNRAVGAVIGGVLGGGGGYVIGRGMDRKDGRVQPKS